MKDIDLEKFNQDLKALAGCRIEIRCDGNLILGTSVAKRPENDKEMAALLREIISIMEAPDVEDIEILGEYSTRTPNQTEGK